MPRSKEVTLDDAYAIAVRNMNAGNYRVAELTLRDILKSVPGHHKSMYLLGMASYHMGNPKEALAHIKKALNGNEATAQWISDYAVILNEQGRHDEAVEAFDKALRRDPKSGQIHWNKCYALWLGGRYAEAEKAGEKAVKLDPKSPEAWLNLGAAKVSQDKMKDAIKCWEKALKLRPDFAFAWNNLGNALRDMGRLKEAEEKCRKALALAPGYVEALNNLGNICLDQGRYAEAEDLYRKAIAGKPDYAEAHNNLCVSLMYQSRYDEAVMHGRYATSFKPHYADAYVNLSEALRNLGLIDDARKAIEQAAILRPDSAEVRMDAADILFMQDMYAEAEVELKVAEKLKPDNPRTYIKLANVQERVGKTVDSLKTIDKAVALNPEMPEAYIRKGQICHVSNRIPEAEKCFLTARKLAPRHPGAALALSDLYLTMGDTQKARKLADETRKLAPNAPGLYNTLSHLKKFTRTDPDFKKMVELEKRSESFGLEQTSTLNFALFSAYEDIGDYKKAFECLKKANDSKRKLIPYQRDRQQLYFEMLKETYTPKFLKSLEGKGHKSDVPVFIVGMPRSGTTLTEQIISSHPSVYGAGELAEMSIVEHEGGGLSPENCRDLGALYVKMVRKLDKSGKALRITDKMPGNYTNIGLIASILPNAKIIHCRRDPVDTCLSCYKQNFARGQYWSYNLEEMAEHYNQYLEIMAYWRKVLPGRFIEIDYEETVGNFEEQARMLVDYVGLPWHKACLSPHKQKRAVLTASKAQVIKPVYKTSVRAWKRYEKQLQPLVKGLKAGKPAPAKAKNAPAAKPDKPARQKRSRAR